MFTTHNPLRILHCCINPCRRYYIGSSKLAELGWVERTSWEEGLKKTIEWWVQAEPLMLLMCFLTVPRPRRPGTRSHQHCPHKALIKCLAVTLLVLSPHAALQALVPRT